MSKKQRVHIISEDGIGANTQLLDADTGQPLNVRVYQVDLSVNTREMWKATLHTYLPVVDILADAEVCQMCRYCKQTLPEGWEAQDTMMANIAKFSQDVKKSREKPLREALDFQYDIERARGRTFTNLSKITVTLEHALAVIEKYKQAIQMFLDEEGKEEEEA